MFGGIGVGRGSCEYNPFGLILLIPSFPFPHMFGLLRRLFLLLMSECAQLVSVSLPEGGSPLFLTATAAAHLAKVLQQIS